MRTLNLIVVVLVSFVVAFGSVVPVMAQPDTMLARVNRPMVQDGIMADAYRMAAAATVAQQQQQQRGVSRARIGYGIGFILAGIVVLAASMDDTEYTEQQQEYFMYGGLASLGIGGALLLGG